MRQVLVALTLCILCISCTNSNKKTDHNFETHFEKTEGLETATYEQTIEFYTNLAGVYPEISIRAIGETDSGNPLHIVTLNPDSEFDFSKIRTSGKSILLINNGIHPGESDGIDATMILFRDIVLGKIDRPKNTVLVTIPVYNIGGSLNRNSSTRTNQNGPKEYGFRGNARNYDLNRDFVKCDTKNARTFAQIFHHIKPDVFIDNHVSNGADYQYTLTHLFTQHNKLGGILGTYLHEHMMPKLEEKLSTQKWDITPYVNIFNEVPENGFSQFMDSPRYSTGYTTLFNTLGMMVETHMLKPYKQRVEGTYALMNTMIDIIEEDHEIIQQKRMETLKNLINHTKTYTLSWKLDTTKTSTLHFKGYEADIVTSDITGLPRLKYDRNKPFTKDINYQNYFKPDITVDVPKAYLIPKGWHNIIELLKLNQVEITTLQQDSILKVERYRIDSFETQKAPYEGHYQHYNTHVSKTEQDVKFLKGDCIIYTNQNALRYLMATLEPQAPDSFFNWNFFDTILQQKEGFSPYVWEDRALDLLKHNPELKNTFEKRKKEDPGFSKNWYAQLDWIHKQSENYEKAHMRYPIYRLKH